MKKTFPLHLPDKKDARVIESIQVTVNKYVKRERRKTLPEGANYWDFQCKVGTNPDAAVGRKVSEISKAIESIALAEHPEVYIEILAVPGHRVKKATDEFAESDES